MLGVLGFDCFIITIYLLVRVFVIKVVSVSIVLNGETTFLFTMHIKRNITNVGVQISEVLDQRNSN